MTGARLAGFKIIVLKLHEYCCNVAFMQYWIQSIAAKIARIIYRLMKDKVDYTPVPSR